MNFIVYMYIVHANEDEILIYKKIQPDFDDGLGNI